MHWVQSLLSPVHPIGVLAVFPALAIWLYRRRSGRGLGWLTALVLAVIAVWALTLRSPILSLIYFELTLGAAVLGAALTVARLARRHWSATAIYLGSLLAGTVAWFAGLLLALMIVLPLRS